MVLPRRRAKVLVQDLQILLKFGDAFRHFRMIYLHLFSVFRFRPFLL